MSKTIRSQFEEAYIHGASGPGFIDACVEIANRHRDASDDGLNFTEDEYREIHAALVVASYEAMKIAVISCSVPSVEWYSGMREHVNKLDKLATRIKNESGAF